MDIAIIGHGRSPEDRNWGPKIDECGAVFRLWNWHWQKPEDFGTKYDYGVLDLTPDRMSEWKAHNKAEPAKKWLGIYVDSSWKNCNVPVGTEKIEQHEWVALAKSMGGSGHARYGGKLELNRGTQAACWAITKLAQPLDRVILVGFDYVVLGRSQAINDAVSQEYLNAAGTWPYTEQYYEPNVRRFGWTDYGIEYPLMNVLANKRRVKLVLAQAIWP